jgi:phage gpG-like protein
MAGVTLSGDWGKFNGHLEKMVFFDFTGLHSEIGEYLVSDTKRRFKEGIDPQGHKWKPSMRARSTGRGKTLIDKAILRNSIGYKASPTQVHVGTNDKRAAIHQKGGVIKPKKKKMLAFQIGGKKIFAKKVTMPRRAFLGINERNTRDIKGIVQAHIGKTLGK